MKTYKIEPNKDYREQNLRAAVTSDDMDLQQDTAKHYDECYRDYLAAWCNLDNLALHYGYWMEATRYRHHQALLEKNQLLYDLAEITADDHVLDAGCGIGGSSIWIGREYGNRVTGITISGKQAAYATKHAQRHKVSEHVDFKVHDFCATGFDDESFDVVWALESSCHALNKGEFLQEAYRLLKKGGRIVVCDGFLLQREFNEQQWQAVVTCLNGWAVPNLCDRPEFATLLQATGFEDIKATDITSQTLPSADYMYKVAKRLYPVQKISQWLGLRSKAQTANYYVGLAQHQLFTEKLTEYCVFTATK